MTEDSGKLASEATRTALADLSNLPKKRGISSILGDLLQKSEDGSGKTVTHEASREKFSKRLCVVVDDLVKENAVLVDDTNGASSSDDDKESEESDDAAAVVVVSSGDVKPLKEIYFEPGDKDGALELHVDADADRTDVSTAGGEGLALSVLSSDDTEIREELTQCQNLRSFEMSRCSNVDKDEHVNMNVGDDLLKSCSCSFCLKAAYIWSDLHYQDIKGRISALKKSQKVASNLIHRNGTENSPDFHAAVNSVGSAKLESNLTGKWKSLFLSMGDILAHESNHLQNSFVTMKELREDCKIDLEKAMKTPQHHT